MTDDLTANKPQKTSTFQVDGISCLDCAAGFEKDVASLPDVKSAVLNRMTGKLTVTGAPDLKAIQRIGRAENYTITRLNGHSSDDSLDLPVDQISGPLSSGRSVSAYENTAGNSNGRKDARTFQRYFAPGTELVRVILSGVLLVTAFLAHAQGDFLRLAVPLFVSATLIGGWSNMKKAFYALPRLNFNMSVLMTVAIVGAMAIGEWGEGAVVAFLFAVSDMLEAWTLSNARRSINSLMKMAPKLATVVKNGITSLIPVEQVGIGDIVIIRPGETVPMDGTVLKGESSVDQSPITGESIPVEKGPGDTVFAGTINSFGALEINVDKRAEDTTFAKILTLVEEAQTKQTSTQAFVDRFAAWYTPAVMIIAALITTIPPLLYGMEWNAWIYRGLALLVVACPCALVVSTPIAIVSAMSRAAKNGVLIKGGIYLEETARVTAVAFDKTGTLTRGKPVVTDIIPISNDPLEPNQTEDQSSPSSPAYVHSGDECAESNRSEKTLHTLLKIAVTIESHSEHPIATAIMEAGNERNIQPTTIENFRAISGRGATALVEGKPALAGNLRLFSNHHIDTGSVTEDVHCLQEEGKTVVIVSWGGSILGLIAVSDDVRDTSFRMIDDLKQSGIRHTVMLTGDHERSARHVATRLGIDDYAADLIPEDKANVIKKLVERYGKVAMVGDGINDAPALATANVGIAMGGAGTDAALETADIALMADDLSKLPYTIRLGRRTLRIIKQNIYFSVIIKLIALVAVFPGWLTLWLAIVSDMGATVIVTLNGMRLLKKE